MSLSDAEIRKAKDEGYKASMDAVYRIAAKIGCFPSWSSIEHKVEEMQYEIETLKSRKR